LAAREIRKMTLHVLVLVGPTASGKTGLGVKVAHHFGSHILSADSRQVYRGLDIGTGKDLDEYGSVDPPVPYHLIDVADPREIYSLFRYQQECYDVIRELAINRQIADGAMPLVMVGGSGMYVEAVVRDYRIADVPRNPELRERFGDEALEELSGVLERESPELAAQTDLTNRRRVIRALEILQYGKHAEIRFSEPPGVSLRFTVFGMKIDRVELRARIRRRLRDRLEEGLVEEVRGLLDRGLPRRRLEDLGLEYREVAAFLGGDKTHCEMVADLEASICRFAKRQETWFRGMARRGIQIRWIEPYDADSVIMACGDGCRL